jgi:hypothetical protein
MIHYLYPLYNKNHIMDINNEFINLKQTNIELEQKIIQLIKYNNSLNENLVLEKKLLTRLEHEFIKLYNKYNMPQYRYTFTNSKL